MAAWPLGQLLRREEYSLPEKIEVMEEEKTYQGWK
jgi:hypothetical protein